MPNFIAKILDWAWFPFVARIVLTLPFWGSGISKAIDFQGAVAEMSQYGLKPPVFIAILVIFTQLGGSLLVFANRRTWSGAGALAIFTLLTIPIAHDFWNLKGDEAKFEFYFAVEHIALVGGLMLAAIMSRSSPRKGA